jgi:hypothetical protein
MGAAHQTRAEQNDAGHSCGRRRGREPSRWSTSRLPQPVDGHDLGGAFLAIGEMAPDPLANRRVERTGEVPRHFVGLKVIARRMRLSHPVSPQ